MNALIGESLLLWLGVHSPLHIYLTLSRFFSDVGMEVVSSFHLSSNHAGDTRRTPGHSTEISSKAINLSCRREPDSASDYKETGCLEDHFNILCLCKSQRTWVTPLWRCVTWQSVSHVHEEILVQLYLLTILHITIVLIPMWMSLVRCRGPWAWDHPHESSLPFPPDISRASAIQNTITMVCKCACGCGLNVSASGVYRKACLPPGVTNPARKEGPVKKKKDWMSRRQEQLRIWSTLLWRQSRRRTLLQRLSFLSTRNIFKLESLMRESWSCHEYCFCGWRTASLHREKGWEINRERNAEGVVVFFVCDGKSHQTCDAQGCILLCESYRCRDKSVRWSWGANIWCQRKQAARNARWESDASTCSQPPAVFSREDQASTADSWEWLSATRGSLQSWGSLLTLGKNQRITFPLPSNYMQPPQLLMPLLPLPQEMLNKTQRPQLQPCHLNPR